MKQNKSKLTLILGLVSAVVIFYLLFSTSSSKDSNSKQKAEIDSLTNRIKNLEQDYARYDSVIKGYEQEIKHLTTKVDETKSKLVKDRVEHGKKISNINKLSVNQLDSFFTNRYK